MSVASAIESLNLKNIRNVVIVMSGKGGVGKSFVATSLAIAFKNLGYSVAILDADIHGPSVPWILGIEDRFMGISIEGNLVPQEVDGIAVASFELLLSQKDNPIVWRGPLKTRAIIELVTKTMWGNRDFMIVDMPPGTGDEHLTIIHMLRSIIRGALLVLTPGNLVAHIVNKVRSFLKNTNVDLLGAILNMSYFRCPVCESIHKIYGEINLSETPILAELPIKPELSHALNEGKLLEYLQKQDKDLLAVFINLCHNILKRLKHNT
ncbi:MAG: P-loop NTPase [Ignisphaera sp.]